MSRKRKAEYLALAAAKVLSTVNMRWIRIFLYTPKQCDMKTPGYLTVLSILQIHFAGEHRLAFCISILIGDQCIIFHVNNIHAI